ncbi:MAG: NADH-quinone oxidoreductase subunit A [Deltaproteobacteria bacterium]|nr:NADH-quinone oxidoreductase subunit A [Deltaproteobacteria bacterium]
MLFNDYLPILLIAGYITFMGAAAVVIAWFLSPKNPYARKLSPWECGVEPIGDADTGHFRVHFFLIAILFVVFDVETLYLFPWAIIIADKSLALIAFIEMVVFIFVLAVGLAYAWKKGALDWFK